MLAKVFSGTTLGLLGVLIEVEVDVAGKGLPTLTIVGLPNKAIDEAKDRVRTAIANASFEMPDSRITVNLAPADIPKEGSSFDLPIALGILAASGAIENEALKKALFVGELSLEGAVRKIPGVISITKLAKEKRMRAIIVPFENMKEAALIDGITVFPTKHLTEVILHLNGQKPLSQAHPATFKKEHQSYLFDFSEVKGQQAAKRALEIAASGFHNIHLKGPPGTGKTMLSRAFPSILPPLEKKQILEVSQIYSVSGLLQQDNLITERPFRSPHHTTSRMGLIGGGSHPKPGEISLAHHGVLFLDEFSEFPRSVLESLRQPMEDGEVLVARAKESILFPSRFLLIAASNPCPCGFLGHPKKPCRCMPGAILKYKKRFSGPLLERIDLHVDVPWIDEERLTSEKNEEESRSIRLRVTGAVNRQKKRFRGLPIWANSQMRVSQIRQFCSLAEGTTEFLKQAISRLSLSARSYFKLIKVAQTIADLDGKEKVEVSFLAEALQYRVKED